MNRVFFQNSGDADCDLWLMKSPLPNSLQRILCNPELLHRCSGHSPSTWGRACIPKMTNTNRGLYINICEIPINSNITVCKTSLHILQTALPPKHNTQAYTVPKTPQPALLASTGTLGVLMWMGCPLQPQGTRDVIHYSFPSRPAHWISFHAWG